MRFFAALLLCFPAAAQVTSTGTILDDDDAGGELWSGVVDADRATDWETPARGAFDGVIPARVTICSTLNPGATAAQINSAIAACTEGQTVFLNAGTYSLSGIIDFGSKSNVTLRGAGAYQTILDVSGTGDCDGLGAVICSSSGGVSESSPPNTTTWTAGYAVGTTVITVGSSANMAVGHLIMLDQLDDATDSGGIYVCSEMGVCADEGGNSPGRTGRSQIHVAKVVAINGNQVTIHPPLVMPNWRSGQSPGVWWNASAPTIEGIGVEDLTVDATDATGRAGIVYLHIRDSWVKGVRGLNADRAHVWLYKSLQLTVRDSYFYGGQGGGSQSYGIETYAGGWNLIENNILNHVTGPIKHNGQDMGSVVAYNFSIDDNYTVSTSWMIPTIGIHEAGVAYVLHEGNDGLGYLHDVIHGTTHLQTAFRNHFYGDVWNNPTKSDNTAVINIGTFGRFFNIVGNVLGRTGYYNTYQTLENTGDTSIYALGWPWDPGEVTDARVEESMLRWGNYDTVNDAVRWESSEVPTGDSFFPNAVPSSQSLPDSFYLQAAPSFWATPWGTPAWPPIGPDVTSGDISGWGGHANKIPARLCYENMPKVSDVVTFDVGTCYAPTDISASLWQDFEFTTLNTTNLAANDHNAGGTWTISDPTSNLSTTTAAEKFTPGTFNGVAAAAGTRGFRYDNPAGDFEQGFITYEYASTHARVSYGFWFKFPAEYVGSFEGGQPDVLYIENGSANRELYIKLIDADQASLILFTPEQGYSAGVDVEPDTWYWLTAEYFTTHRMRVYDVNGNQVGSEQTRTGTSQQSNLATLGNLIGDEGGGGPFDFDDWVMDWFDATFPLGPPQ